MPASGNLAYNDNTYQGSFLVITKNNKIHLINSIGLEDYVLSVLCSESWPGWPLEVNKVLAIACRSYAIFMILEAQAQERIFHIKNTNAHQTYNGLGKNSHLKEAVDATQGIFLSHNKKPIIAMFDSCCGGVIPAKIKGKVDFVKAPYLARSYPCDFCKRCKLYKWSASYQRTELEETFKKAMPKLKRIKDVTVAKKDAAGLVHELSIKSGSGYHTIPGKKVYSLLKDGVKSFCYTINKKSETIVFEGRGYGHHMGLCQWGSREMVRDGQSYQEILQFYYPGTQFMRLV
jgi:stage II sporulation protein D